MTVLYTQEGDKYYPWSSGSTPLITDKIERGMTLIICVKCSFGDNPDKHFSLFDTGSRYTVIPQEVADNYPSCFSSLDYPIRLDTRLGKINGELNLCNLRILADSGEDISFESTVLVSPEWNAPIVIGFTSLLDKIRWACDPTIDQQGRLYFGIDQ